MLKINIFIFEHEFSLSVSLPLLVPYLVPILFSLIIVIGSIGNILVVLVVALNKNMRNNTNRLILNLAVSGFRQIVRESF